MSAKDILRSFATTSEPDDAVIPTGITYGTARELMAEIENVERAVAEALRLLRSSCPPQHTEDAWRGMQVSASIRALLPIGVSGAPSTMADRLRGLADVLDHLERDPEFPTGVPHRDAIRADIRSAVHRGLQAVPDDTFNGFLMLSTHAINLWDFLKTYAPESPWVAKLEAAIETSRGQSMKPGGK